MKEVLARNWWVFVVRGLLAIAFGVGAFVMPGMTLKVLVLVYGAYALADGVMATVGAFGRHRPGDDFPWSMLFVGLAGIVAGVLTFFFPGLTALVLLYLIAAWHVVRGTFEIAAAIRLRKEIEGEGWLILAGVLSVLFGLFLYVRPGAGALALVWTIGAFAIAFGLITLLLGFRLRKVTPAS